MLPRVLVVVPRLDIGGAEMHLVRVLPELRRRGLDMSLFVLSRGGPLEQRLAGTGVDLLGPTRNGAGPMKSLVALRALRRELRRLKPDIVHTFLPEAYLIGSLAVAGMGCVAIMSRRSLADYQAHHPFLARVERWLHRSTRVLLGNSTAVIEQLIEECGTPAKVGLIHNGIAMPTPTSVEARRTARHELGIPDEAFVMAVIANFIPYKGHDDLFDALGSMGDRAVGPWRLMLLGRDGDDIERLRAKTSALGFAANVLWLTGRTDAQAPLDAADIGILPSHQEGFSNSLIEKMARGLAVIATRVGGNGDAIVDRESGLLVPVHDPAALNAAIAELWANADLRRRLGDAARERVWTQFSIDRCAERYLNLYSGVLGDWRGSIQGVIDASR